MAPSPKPKDAEVEEIRRLRERWARLVGLPDPENATWAEIAKMFTRRIT